MNDHIDLLSPHSLLTFRDLLDTDFAALVGGVFFEVVQKVGIIKHERVPVGAEERPSAQSDRIM